MINAGLDEGIRKAVVMMAIQESSLNLRVKSKVPGENSYGLWQWNTSSRALGPLPKDFLHSDDEIAIKVQTDWMISRMKSYQKRYGNDYNRIIVSHNWPAMAARNIKTRYLSHVLQHESSLREEIKTIK